MAHKGPGELIIIIALPPGVICLSNCPLPVPGTADGDVPWELIQAVSRQVSFTIHNLNNVLSECNSRSKLASKCYSAHKSALSPQAVPLPFVDPGQNTAPQNNLFSENIGEDGISCRISRVSDRMNRSVRG